jgi:hypothetical protein
MIKGINKQVLEVIETNNGYFEKALFFVKPEFSGYSESKLRELAQAEIKSTIHPPKQKLMAEKNKTKTILSMLLTFFVGLLIGTALSFIV